MHCNKNQLLGFLVTGHNRLMLHYNTITDRSSAAGLEAVTVETSAVCRVKFSSHDTSVVGSWRAIKQAETLPRGAVKCLVCERKSLHANSKMSGDIVFTLSKACSSCVTVPSPAALIGI